LRPVFEHPIFTVLKANHVQLPLDVFGDLGKALSGDPIPIRYRLDNQTDFVANTITLSVDHADVRFRGSPQSNDPRHYNSLQGVLEVDVYFTNDQIQIQGNVTRGDCSGQVTLDSDGVIIFRMFFEPTFSGLQDPADLVQLRAGAVSLTSGEADMVQNVETQEPGGFRITGADCDGQTAVRSCNVDTPERRDLIKKMLIGQLSNQLSRTLASTLALVYDTLLFTPAVGELLFRVQPSCLEGQNVRAIENVRISPNRADTIFRKDPGMPAALCLLPASDSAKMCH